jgi:hypothetical protein
MNMKLVFLESSPEIKNDAKTNQNQKRKYAVQAKMKETSSLESFYTSRRN